MMKINIFLILVLFCGINILAQTSASKTELQKIVETEKSFAQFAAEKGTKAAFLEFAADDGIVFQPNPVNAKTYWNSRDESKGFLAWQPDFADIASNGALGYTSGPWEFRPKGKTDAPVAFGHFVTLWQKQANGTYRWVVDIGVPHAQAQVEGVEWKTSSVAATESNAKNSYAGDDATAFFESATQNGLNKAYKTFAAEDIRVYRANKMPILGKSNLLSEIKKDKSSVAFAKRSVFFGSADLAYITNAYTLTKPDNTVEKGNFMQIWKLRNGKWQIVLDIFNPLPEEKK